MNKDEDYDEVYYTTREFEQEVKRKFDRFWMNNQLGYDEFGNVIRTDIPRKKPKEWQEFVWGSVKNRKIKSE